MLLGATGQLAERALATSGDRAPIVGAAVIRRPWRVTTLDASDLSARDPQSGSWLEVCGNPLIEGVTHRAQWLLRALIQRGYSGLEPVEGAFALVWWDASRARLVLLRDRFGAEPFYYTQRDGDLVFGSRVRDFVAVDGRGFEVSTQGLVEFLTYCFIPGDATLDRDVWRVPAGSIVAFDVGTRKTTVDPWYRLSYAQPLERDENVITTRYRDLLESAVTRRLSGSPAGAFLSGGMDSSSVVTFMRRHLPGEIDTFGFRCAGASFDESFYARGLAAELGTTHREVEFGEAQSLDVLQSVRSMEVPFCDIGIEVGTWLLARCASGHVNYLLTGDGGDELWASHPIYAAQKLVNFYDRVPMPKSLKRGVERLTHLVRDSDKKRNLAVVVKRLLPRVDLPVPLGPYRWRVYYTQPELANLLHPTFASRLGGIDPYACVLEAFQGYDGPDDGISEHLYNDYRTASSFYFSRLMLARTFGVEVRTPFYDRALVEYGARIPADLKLEGVERTKRLFRKAMQGVLPDVVNGRKDKLGHSVPLKNWLRMDGALGTRVTEALRASDAPIAQILRPDRLERLIEEHRARRHNHSHRLWAAFVLDAWLRERTVPRAIEAAA
ncbi:MAG: asparagine synthase-related protein [Gammaproteobacteria bacterium]